MTPAKSLELNSPGSAWRLDTAPPPITKRYFAGGQQIAMRLGDGLYYTLSDPSGTSMQIVDSQGITAGHVLSDPYGRVITNSLSDELQEAFVGTGSLVDTTTNLVHLGGGRFYDPELGRSLQPDPMGGPPSVPQALNRYAATAVGQPGVAEAVSATGCLANKPCTMGADILVDLGALATGNASRLESLLSIRLARLTMRGRNTPIKTNRAVKAFFNRSDLRNLSRGRTGRIQSEFVFLVRGDRILPFGLRDVHNVDNVQAVTKKLQNSLGWGVSLSPSRALGDIRFKPKFYGKIFSAAEFLEGGAAGFFFDAGWSYWQDSGNPYLTSGQKWARAGVVGGVGFVAGIGVVLAVGTGPAGFFVSLIVGWTIEPWISNRVFEAFPNTFQPNRRLRPLP
jgi:hypothetical protein